MRSSSDHSDRRYRVRPLIGSIGLLLTVLSIVSGTIFLVLGTMSTNILADHVIDYMELTFSTTAAVTTTLGLSRLAYPLIGIFLCLMDSGDEEK